MNREDIIWKSIERNIQSLFESSEVVDAAIEFATPKLKDALERLENNPEKYYKPEDKFAYSKAANRLYEDFGYSLKDMVGEINDLKNCYSGKRLFYNALYYIVDYWHDYLK